MEPLRDRLLYISTTLQSTTSFALQILSVLWRFFLKYFLAWTDIFSGRFSYLDACADPPREGVRRHVAGSNTSIVLHDWTRHQAYGDGGCNLTGVRGRTPSGYVVPPMISRQDESPLGGARNNKKQRDPW